MASIKQQVLVVIESREWYNFKDLIKGNRKKRYLVDFEETLGELSRGLQTDLWNSLYRSSIQVFRNKSPETIEDDVDPMDVDDDSDQQQKELDNISFQVVIAIGQITLKLIKANDAFIPASLIEFMVYLGSILGELEDPICNQAVDLCEEWIQREFPRSETIQMNTAIVLIGLSLHTDAKKQTVKRVWGLKKVLPPLITNCKSDSDDDPIASLLLSCPAAMVYLACEEGIKFLSELFSQPQLTDDCHKVVKQCLPSCNRNQSTAYAKVYFRAWKTAQRDVKKILEENCLQDLMYATVHMDPNSNLAGNLRNFLQYVHSYKKNVQTSAMIYKLYEPFIWRSLKAANGYVRLNVTVLLCDAFPLGGDGTHEEEEILLERQYKAILELLVDPCHLVRNAAIKGSFLILTHYWRMLPSHVIQQIFQIYIGKLLRDVSNAEGRMHVITGCTQLLDCAEAFSFMTNILPRIADSCDDVNLSVRIAYIKLLIKLKATRHIKYWKLTKMDHLLHRLDQDSQTRPYILKLIHNSFVPGDLNEKDWLQRTISFVTMNRGATRRFYQLSSKRIDLESLTRFMLYIWRIIFRYVRLSAERHETSSGNCNETSKENDSFSANTQNGPKNSSSGDKSNSKENADQSIRQESIALDNTEVTAGLVDIIVIMWTVNTDRFNSPENLKYIDGLRNRIAKCFPVVWSFFKESEIANSLLYLSSLLPSSFAPTMSGFCMSQLKQVSDHENHEDMVNLCLTALCNWNRLDDILQLTSDWLTKSFDSIETSAASSRSKSRKKVCFQNSPPKPLIGLSFLKLLLRHRLNRLCLLHKNRHLVYDLCDLMSRIKEVTIKRTSVGKRLSPVCSDEFLLTCYEDYLTLVILLHKTKHAVESMEDIDNKRHSDAVEIFTDSMILMESLLDDCLPTDAYGASFDISCVLVFVQCSTSLLATGTATVNFVQNLLGFIQLIFNKGIERPQLYKEVFLLLKETEKYLDSYGCNVEGEKDSSLVLNLLKAIMLDNILKGTFSTKSAETKNCIIDGIVSILQYCQVYPDWLQSMISLLIDFVQEKVVNRFEEEGFDNEVEDFLGEEVSFIILKKIISKEKFATVFYTCLLNSIKSIHFTIQQVFAMLYLLTKTANNGGGKTNKLKSQLIEATQQLLFRIDAPSDDDSRTEFIGSCLKKAEELLATLQNN